MSSNWKPTPCKGCGGEKEKGAGKRYCIPCREKAKPIWEQKNYQSRLIRNREARTAQGKGFRYLRDAPEGQKWCARCRQYLDLGEFTRQKTKINSYCKPCHSAYLHERAIKVSFGMSPEEYERLMVIQGGVCAICEKKPRSRRLAVDHNHSTGEIRGLLCTRCNHKTLGGAGDSATLLRRAAQYLESPPALTGEPVPTDPGDVVELFLTEEMAHLKSLDSSQIRASWIPVREMAIEDCPVMLPPEDFVRLLREAGYGPPWVDPTPTQPVD